MPRISTLLCALVLVLPALTVSAKAACGQNGAIRTPCENLDAHEDPKGRLMRVVVDEPFSADWETSATRTLEDGTKVEKHGTDGHQYRDSLGRTRFERPVQPPIIGRVVPTQQLGFPATIEIEDPVALKEYWLYPSRHEARVRNAPELGQRTLGSRSGSQEFPRPEAPDTDLPRPKSTTEYFGTQSIDGLQAVGMKEVTTFPTGWEGNDRPYSSWRETWCSVDLRVIVLNKLYNPNMGETVQRLTNINRAEPDPSLFELPADYTISEMKPGVVFSLGPGVTQQPSHATPIR
jgi:hypothetical protein